MQPNEPEQREALGILTLGEALFIWGVLLYMNLCVLYCSWKIAAWLIEGWIFAVRFSLGKVGAP